MINYSHFHNISAPFLVYKKQSNFSSAWTIFHLESVDTVSSGDDHIQMMERTQNK